VATTNDENGGFANIKLKINKFKINLGGLP